MHRAEFENAVKSQVKLWAIGQKHRHPIARTHTLGLQQSGHRIAQPVQLGKTELVAVVNHGRLIRGHCGPMTQVACQRQFPQRVLRCGGHAFRPGLAPQGLQRGLTRDILKIYTGHDIQWLVEGPSVGERTVDVCPEADKLRNGKP